MKVYKALYSRGSHLFTANSQEEAVFLSRKYSDKFGILISVFEI